MDFDNSVFQIPVPPTPVSTKVATDVEPLPATPELIERAFPVVDQAAVDFEIYQELSAVSEEVMSCRNTALSNIY